MGNIVQNIDYPVKLCYDNNKWLIALWNYVISGGKLPEIMEIDKDEYMSVWDSFKKKDGRYEDWYYAYVGFLCFFQVNGGVLLQEVQDMKVELLIIKKNRII